jgi:hypothetical protein
LFEDKSPRHDALQFAERRISHRRDRLFRLLLVE